MRSLSRTRGGVAAARTTNGIKHTAGGIRNTRNHFVTASSARPSRVGSRVGVATGAATSHRRTHAHTIGPGAAAKWKKRSAAEAAGKAEDRQKDATGFGRHQEEETHTCASCARTNAAHRGAEHRTCKRVQAGCGTAAVASRDSAKMNEKSAAVAGTRVR
ncbi:hypothetical protein MTO96_049428 [Rhipicephalus appendiculatus]